MPPSNQPTKLQRPLRDDEITIKVILNGTDKNRWHRWGFKHNPFPQVGMAEFDQADMQVNSLDGDPLTGPEDIAARLKGFAPEFVQLCQQQFKRGERVAFYVSFPR